MPSIKSFIFDAIIFWVSAPLLFHAPALICIPITLGVDVIMIDGKNTF